MYRILVLLAVLVVALAGKEAAPAKSGFFGSKVS